MYSKLPRRIRCFLATRRIFHRMRHMLYPYKRLSLIVRGLRIVLAGFWLGVLDKASLDQIDEIFFSNIRAFQTPDYNLMGLWPWEKEAIETGFPTAGRLLVGAAGCGREVIALARMGYQVAAFECNERLAAIGNNILESQGISTRIDIAPRDCSTAADGLFDGILVGWGAYTLIQSRASRVAFLKDLRSRLSEGSPMLLSFFTRGENALGFRMVALIGNAIRVLLGRERLELGDDLDDNFAHAFTSSEIASELAEAGLRLESFSSRDYGHATARSVGPVQQ